MPIPSAPPPETSYTYFDLGRTPKSNVRIDMIFHSKDGRSLRFYEVLAWGQNDGFVWVKYDDEVTGQWAWSYYAKETIERVEIKHIER